MLWENQYSEFHVKGIFNKDIPKLCPTFEVNTPILNLTDLIILSLIQLLIVG
jgi:hypothetical protein